MRVEIGQPRVTSPSDDNHVFELTIGAREK